MATIGENIGEDPKNIIEDLKKQIIVLKDENHRSLKEIEERIKFIENFLIHNTRGYYLKALKKM